MADDDALFQKGMPIRREVLSPDYVDASMARADEFMMSFQRATTSWAWGWARGRSDTRPQDAEHDELGDADRLEPGARDQIAR